MGRGGIRNSHPMFFKIDGRIEPCELMASKYHVSDHISIDTNVFRRCIPFILIKSIESAMIFTLLFLLFVHSNQSILYSWDNFSKVMASKTIPLSVIGCIFTELFSWKLHFKS